MYTAQEGMYLRAESASEVYKEKEGDAARRSW